MIGSIFSKSAPVKSAHVEVRKTLEQYSPIEESIPFMMEIMKEQVDIAKSLNNAVYYSAIYESEEILTEGVSDFFKSVQQFIKKVIQKVREMFANFMIHINAKVMDTDRFITKYKTKLLKLDVNFEVDVHEFNVKQSEPNFDVTGKIVDSYNIELKNLQNKTHADFLKERAENVRLNKSALTRASIIGHTQPLTNQEILQKYKIVVYGGKSKVITISNSNYQQYVNGYSDIKTKLNDIKKDNDLIVSGLNELLVFFKQSPSQIYHEGNKTYSGRHISLDDKNNIHREDDEELFEDNVDNSKKVLDFFNGKYTEVSETISLINSLLAIKMSAVRDELSQYSKIIKMGIKSSNQEKGSDV